MSGVWGPDGSASGSLFDNSKIQGWALDAMLKQEKTFFAADDQKHGREPLWDCVDAKKYLASLPNVDGKRIGIDGGSYGGGY